MSPLRVYLSGGPAHNRDWGGGLTQKQVKTELRQRAGPGKITFVRGKSDYIVVADNVTPSDSALKSGGTVMTLSEFRNFLGGKKTTTRKRKTTRRKKTTTRKKKTTTRRKKTTRKKKTSTRRKKCKCGCKTCKKCNR